MVVFFIGGYAMDYGHILSEKASIMDFFIHMQLFASQDVN